MPLRRGVTALAKLKMLRKKYPCDWPGKRDGTHAPAASAWLVGPRSLSPRCGSTGAMSSEGCLHSGDACWRFGVWTPQSRHRAMNSIAKAWEMQTPTSPHQPGRHTRD